MFPTTIANNVLPVATNILVPPPPLAFQPDVFQPFLEISREFVLTQAQVDGEEHMRLAAPLARLAASAVAAAEDTILFFGPTQIGAVLATGVTVTNQPGALPLGFVAEAAAYAAIQVPPVPRPNRGPPPVAAGDLGQIVTAVAQGIAALNRRAQPGPYALFVPPRRFAQIFAPVGPGFLETPGDQLNHVVTGGLYMVNSLGVSPPAPPFPNEVGILVSLGGEPAKIILGTEATTAFTRTDPQGNYNFRVFERIQMVVRDGRAFQTIQFL